MAFCYTALWVLISTVDGDIARGRQGRELYYGLLGDAWDAYQPSGIGCVYYALGMIGSMVADPPLFSVSSISMSEGERAKHV